MEAKKIKTIHAGHFHHIADLETTTPLPNRGLEHLDPFLFLNHHGSQFYPPNNQGLPFGPHPHRGMETLTFIIEGDIKHRDSHGHESTIAEGGIQWMCAGSGLLHEEVSSEKFKREGGQLEILQLWLNLPAKKKMTAPAYSGLQKEDIPVYEQEGVRAQVLFGSLGDVKGPLEPNFPLTFYTLYLEEGAEIRLPVEQEEQVFLYPVQGTLQLNDTVVKAKQLPEFHMGAGEIHLHAKEKSIVLFGRAKPFQEPIVMQGPFVMNSMREIQEAYMDYQNGRFGRWS
ncbi:MAG: pirin family protein [Nitritalea sp.]